MTTKDEEYVTYREFVKCISFLEKEIHNLKMNDIAHLQQSIEDTNKKIDKLNNRIWVMYVVMILIAMAAGANLVVKILTSGLIG
ncbi:MAG: hypothetical protein ABEK36_06260 [Candidatus Aenigmatarchaeota archaeon]